MTTETECEWRQVWKDKQLKCISSCGHEMFGGNPLGALPRSPDKLCPFCGERLRLVAPSSEAGSSPDPFERAEEYFDRLKRETAALADSFRAPHPETEGP